MFYLIKERPKFFRKFPSLHFFPVRNKVKWPRDTKNIFSMLKRDKEAKGYIVFQQRNMEETL